MPDAQGEWKDLLDNVNLMAGVSTSLAFVGFSLISLYSFSARI